MARDSQGELVTRGSMSATTWRRTWPRPGSRATQNITVFDKPIEKMVCVMQEDEFVSTWVANKAVYRTRMATGQRRRAGDHCPGVEAVRRAGGRRRVDSQVWLRRHAAGDGAVSRPMPTCRTWPTPRPT